MSRFDIMDYIYEIIDPSFPRLGPGDSELTLKALNMLLPVMGHKPTDSLRVLDIGCGNGAQSLDLASQLNGTITAIDNHQPFLDELRRRVQHEGLSDKIRPILGDMNDLGMEKESFDLVWAEGSLYHAGFEQGIDICRDMLVPGGGLGASELSWLKPDPPEECREFFAEIYPAMVDIESNIATISKHGFEVIGHFALPDVTWWEPFYTPLDKRIKVLRAKYASDPNWMNVLDSFQREIEIFSKYSAYYGEVFYVMKRY